MQGRKAMLILHGKQAMNEALRSAVCDLRDTGWVLDVRVTWEAGDAQRLVGEALAAGYSHIVAGGGDGTLRDVAEAMGLADAEASLALLPLGTANDFAKAAGIPLEPAEALALLNTPAQAIDLGQAGDQLFLNMATGGFGSQVTANTSEDLKKVLGAAAYLFTGLSRFSELQAATVELQGPDFQWQGSLLALGIGNGRQAGGGQVLCPEAVVNDGLLDIAILPAPQEVVGALRDLLAGDGLFVRARLPWVEIKARRAWTSTSMASRCRPATCAFKPGLARCSCTCRPGRRCLVIQADDFLAYSEQHQAGHVSESAGAS